jgi:sporulation protein YlmC with PRC-barrel domain
MNASSLKGRSVISRADGSALGTIDDIYVDAGALALLGFFVEPAVSGDAATIYLDPSDISSIGPDAVMVENRDAMRGEATRARVGALVNLDDVLKRAVVTESGAQLGALAEIDIEPPSAAFTQLVVSPGLLKSNWTIPIEQVRAIGPEFVIVADAADPARGQTDATPAGESVIDDGTPIDLASSTA